MYGLATTSIHLRLTQRTIKTGTSIYQSRPTSATRNIRPVAHIYDSTIPATDITHLAEDTNTTTTIFTHTFVIPTINCHFCYICHLAFVSFIVCGCHYSHALTKKHLRGQRAYRLHDSGTI